MKVNFEVACSTRWGQEVYVEVGSQIIKLQTNDGQSWIGIFSGSDAYSNICYRYFIQEDDNKTYEFGEDRTASWIPGNKSMLIRDTWRDQHSLDNSLYTAPFQNAFFKHPFNAYQSTENETTIFQLRAIRINSQYQMGILGSCEALGSWSEDRIILMEGTQFPVWRAYVEIDLTMAFEYKYVIYSRQEKKIVAWETGKNRFFDPVDDQPDQFLQTDEYFRYPSGLWKAAGVALPVFSLRSEQSAGVGEFNDIPLMVDWAVATGMRIFQVLPVNDTVAHHSWTDSYPYAAVSVHALHPIYANMECIGPLKDRKKWKEIKAEASKLNAQKELDYVGVMRLKSAYFKLSYDENRSSFIHSAELEKFLKDNHSWIHDYAAFSCLRDRYQTPNFNHWGKHTAMTDDQVYQFTAPDTDYYDDIAVHFYIQYHLDKQLKEATQYARTHRVVLKGDIPIGIYRHSVDAWRKPDLFHLDKQAGAPPDMFSTTGQNWGFPTYNWERMKENGYAWWTDRLAKMKEYFDIVRIDHILGFFRIWQMKAEDILGLLGAFYPALPIDEEEINNWGIPFEEARYCHPFLPPDLVKTWSGNLLEVINGHFMEEAPTGNYQFKEPFYSQRAIAQEVHQLVKKGVVDASNEKDLNRLLFKMQSEVLFIIDDEGRGYHPRNELYNTQSFASLSEYEQHQLKALHEHYFYHRHNDFWRASGLEKLPAVKDATNMLVCGEDLGMVPASVPGVMNELQILRLYVQRNPDSPAAFEDPEVINYLSVKSTGNHDVETLRQWWTEDPERRDWIYRELLGFEGDVPDEFTPEIAKRLLHLHFESNAMLVINPLQDYMALSKSLRRKEMNEERINIPENPHHAWRYRFHMNMEDLCKAKELNLSIRKLVENSNRLGD